MAARLVSSFCPSRSDPAATGRCLGGAAGAFRGSGEGINISLSSTLTAFCARRFARECPSGIPSGARKD